MLGTVGIGFLYTTSIGLCNLFILLSYVTLQYCREAAGPQTQGAGPSPVSSLS